MGGAASGLITDGAGVARCFWQPSMPDYHDHEWGRPVADDRRLYEKICLEGFQAGMAWITILRKREAFRAAFDDFDFERVARYTERDVERLMADPGIVRNRNKIVSAINNARRARELAEETGSLAGWLWKHEPAPRERPSAVDLDYWNNNPTSAASVALSRALKQRGWTFVGPTTLHAFMQAVGMVNDHLDGCVCRETVERARADFKRPS
ncbi:DNA-3-methyladenine glycosylase I [Achromobacter denitrificans]|uniref:DNA-3-methyladenine glycosylase I n=1 Tax=Achromobacter denitrificans TaxID=32002 RepID=UPI00078901B9|nr:DNA-3-methyladenine glycosylase I [Achromobacter denitrificans]MPT41592.1 DNA-3-methyladenine glycosylase I [Achromobacter sp.]MDF3852211.1 DNA-3-methyladenine glycosylase I [Achromobacter denitrificans]MDF3938769.1 DNA-3-methyladenine glycosylase I [Achromobacter denitrificans]OLU09592.1 3-methyladenine DNA glycosylase [Achromobacter denitrificans]QCS66942.1 DNA-3-methyladenine glycosylase I [Achromobacter denitrificans]